MNEDQNNRQTQELNIEEELKQIVIQRLKGSSDELQVVIGGKGDFTKEELINSVEVGDEVGQEIMESEIEFMKAMAQGKIYSP